jgi:hypothetical protein
MSEKEYAAANALAVDWFLPLRCWGLQQGASNNCRPKGTTGTETAHVHFSYRSKLQEPSGQGNSWQGNMLMSSNSWSLEFQEFPPRI